MSALRLGGLVPLSTVDWPEMLAATVFCQGCPWSCRYCHNPHLLASQGPVTVPWTEVMALLRRRRGLLDGVVFSGGEPTLQAALPEALAEVRALGLKCALHTAGPYPERLAPLLPLVDWIGFDVKAPFADYPRITGVAGSGETARASLELVLASGVACQVRTTVHPVLLDEAALAALSAELAELGVTGHLFQSFRPRGCRDLDL